MSKRTRYVFGAALAGVAFMAVTAPSYGTLLFTTGFNQTVTTANPVTYHDGILASNVTPAQVGQNGWNAISGGGTNPEMVSNSATNGVVSLTTSGEDDAVPLTTASATNGSVFLDADINVSAAQAAGDYFLHIGVSTSIFGLHLYAKSTTGGYLLGITPSNLASGAVVGYGTVPLPFGVSEHVELEYDFVAGTANDTAELFVNPVSGVLPPTDIPYASDTNAAGGALGSDITVPFTTANVRQGSAGSAPTETVDNIVVNGNGTVPEPASLGVIGLLSTALLGRRRKR
jgi:hypothetical protein